MQDEQDDRNGNRYGKTQKGKYIFTYLKNFRRPICRHSENGVKQCQPCPAINCPAVLFGYLEQVTGQGFLQQAQQKGADHPESEQPPDELKPDSRIVNHGVYQGKCTEQRKWDQG